jgi:hypothetical protein
MEEKYIYTAIELFEMEQLKKLIYREKGKMNTLMQCTFMYQTSENELPFTLLKRAGVYNKYMESSQKLVNAEKELHDLENKRAFMAGVRMAFPG